MGGGGGWRWSGGWESRGGEVVVGRVAGKWFSFIQKVDCRDIFCYTWSSLKPPSWNGCGQASGRDESRRRDSGMGVVTNFLSQYVSK